MSWHRELKINYERKGNALIIFPTVSSPIPDNDTVAYTCICPLGYGYI